MISTLEKPTLEHLNPIWTLLYTYIDLNINQKEKPKYKKSHFQSALYMYSRSNFSYSGIKQTWCIISFYAKIFSNFTFEFMHNKESMHMICVKLKLDIISVGLYPDEIKIKRIYFQIFQSLTYCIHE